MAVHRGWTTAANTHRRELTSAARNPGNDLHPTPSGGGAEPAVAGPSQDAGCATADSITPPAAPETEPGDGANNPPCPTHDGRTTTKAARQTNETVQAIPKQTPIARVQRTQGMRIISANVQKCRENTHVLLEKYRDADIICVQEPCWTYVKSVVSSDHKDGRQTFGTVQHRNFITLGDSESSRVTVYIHREKWAKASPRIRTKCISHADVICISMTMEGRELSFLNVYNDSRTFAALDALLMRANDIPPISFMAGDFNIRHPMWDKNERRFDQRGLRTNLRNTSRAEQLISLATDHLGLVLANDPQGPPTWYSNNLGVREGVIDLLWADPDLPQIPKLRVNDQGRHNSDHAILEWTLPIDLRIPRDASIPREGERGARFTGLCRQYLSEVCPTSPDALANRQDISRVAEKIEDALRRAWQQCAKVPNITNQSKTWWNQECGTLARSIRDARKEQKKQRHLRTKAQRALRDHDDSDILQRRERIKEAARLTGRIQALDNTIKRTRKQLRGAIRGAKARFFNRKIEATEPARIWDLVNWTKPRSADATNCILKKDGTPTQSQKELGETFQDQFTPKNPQKVDFTILEEIEQIPMREFNPISTTEIAEALARTGNFSAPGPDHVSWYWLKQILSPGEERGQAGSSQQGLMERLAIFFNACINVGIQPAMFKASRTVVIPKPNKPDYTKAKAYRPIVLLNCLGKLLEKVIARRLQFEAQKFGILHPCQFGGAMQHSTTDAGMQLVHNIKQAWHQGLDSSAILLDIAQFFPSINHELLAGILRRQGFDERLCNFFSDYLVDRKTQFQFNGSTLDPLDFSTGVGQGSSLSPILTGLFLAPILHRAAPTKQIVKLQFEGSTHRLRHDWSPRTLQGNGLTTLQFFVDDGLIHVAGKLDKNAEPGDQLKYNVILLKNLYNSLAEYLGRAGLRVEADKLELMHFVHRQRRRRVLDGGLGPALKIAHEGTITTVRPSQTMRYLGFYLDPTLSFKEHVRFYSTKGCSTVQALRMLGNSNRGLAPTHRRTLYLTNVLPVLLYGVQLWWSPYWKGTKGLAKSLQLAQSRAARWITGAFHTTPIGAMEAAAGLLPMKLQIDKAATREGLRTLTLHNGHSARAILGQTWRPNRFNISAPLPLKDKQGGTRNAETPYSHIKDRIPQLCQEEFDATNHECRPGSRIIDMFHNQIRTHLKAPPKGSDAYHSWLRNEFRPRMCQALGDRNASVLFTDGSALTETSPAKWPRTGAGYIIRSHTKDKGVTQCTGTMGCGNVTPFDAEMIALARGISKMCDKANANVTTLHIFTDNKAALQRTLNPALGPAQMCAILAAKTLRQFLERSPDHEIHLHWCPAHQGIALNEAVDALAKQGAEGPQPAFTSLAKARQIATNNVAARWGTQLDKKTYMGQQTFLKQGKGMITHTSKNWYIKNMGHRPRELARNVRFTTGHFPCGAFRTRFHIPGPTSCWWCKDTPDTREHALHQCPGWSRAASGAKIRPDQLPPGQRWQNLPARTRESPNETSGQGNERREHSTDQQVDPQSIRTFLQLNPMLGTFAWSEIVAAAEEDWAKGLTAESSINIFRASAHSGWRQQERELWLARIEEKQRAFGDKPLSPAKLEQRFVNWYGQCMVQHICTHFGCLERRRELEEEFGIQKRNGNNRQRARAGDGKQRKRRGPSEAGNGRRAGTPGDLI